ncbi:unnamed protein product [Rhodiola kirilowii]
MEAVKSKIVCLAAVAVIMAASSVQMVSAADAPAPSPDSGATAFVPAVFASIAAAAFGLLF